MATEDIKKRDLVRTVLQHVVIKSLGDTLSLMKLEVSDDNISRLQSYQGTIKRKLGAVKTIEKELIDLYKEPLDISIIINEGMEFDVECNTKLNILEKLLNNHVKEDKKLTKGNSNLRNPIEKVKLSKMKIRRFSGDPTKWETFCNSFKTYVHASSLSDTQTFRYLIGCLEGDALNAILGLGPTSQNYTQALELSEKRFSNR